MIVNSRQIIVGPWSMVHRPFFRDPSIDGPLRSMVARRANMVNVGRADATD